MVFLVFSAYDLLLWGDYLWYTVKIRNEKKQRRKNTVFVEKSLEDWYTDRDVHNGDLL